MQLRNPILIAAGILTLAGCTTALTNHAGAGIGRNATDSSTPTSRYCADCGIVTRIAPLSSNESAPTSTGAVLGGIVGAVAGRQISKEAGGGNSNKGTGGTLAGNAIQNQTTRDTYKVTVHMDDGRTIVVNQQDLAGVRENSYVRVINGRVMIR